MSTSPLPSAAPAVADLTAGPGRMPLSKILAVLLGFPVGSTLISLLLLDRSIFAWSGLEFFTALWALIVCWYLAQIAILSRVLKAAGWRWADIGYAFDRRKTAYLIGGYLVFALALLGFIELAVAQSGTDPAKLAALSDLADLTPTNSAARVVFVCMALVAALSEELVYRGFAITALKSRGVNPWLANLFASIPFVLQHGLKAMDQFWWFFVWAIVFGGIFIVTKRLYLNIVVHWLLILSAMTAVLSALK